MKFDENFEQQTKLKTFDKFLTFLKTTTYEQRLRL